MKRKNIFTATLLLAVAVLMLLPACSRMKIGYLRTAGASFAPDTLNVYRNIDPSSSRFINQSPWTSTRIQGVAGTNPINYEYAGVKVSNGGDASLFDQVVKDRLLLVQGGMIQLFQDGVKRLPNGRYTLSLRVYNEDHSQLLKDVFTLIIEEQE